ncbi:hypothetical protein [Streptomyces sp. NPDC053560]|uniref:hypothetical protein n=1 Tax=Streptomyces sp. NPDC053560 TaxID=3365711 RepID=UPI0037D75E69
MSLLATVVRTWPGRRADHRGFHRGSPWVWCPAEETETPHQLDAGVRHCLSCKTSTTKGPTMDEPFGPEYVKPKGKDCPNCLCCTQALCERGRNSVLECAGHTTAELREVVFGCPCSAARTPKTASWRASQVRATRMAREVPLGQEAELLLRALADGRDVDEDGEHFPQLKVRGLADLEELRPVVTELGRTYLAARDDVRADTPVRVVDVDVPSRTARVEVAAWQPDKPVTVLLDQVLSDSGLDVDSLPGRWLTAEANCHADEHRLVLTGFRKSEELPAGWMSVGEDA